MSFRDFDQQGNKPLSPVLNHISFDGKAFDILSPSVDDHIARHLAKGKFYEEEELRLMQAYVTAGAVVVDVGANIGNHTIFFECVMKAEKVIPFEMHPTLVQIFQANADLNGLKSVVYDYLGTALWDKPGIASLVVNEKNYGMTRLAWGKANEITVPAIVGDHALLGERSIEFIKIDVEGGEINVLDGLKETIAKNRPLLFIEVMKETEKQFEYWMDQNLYQVVDRFKRYEENENYLIRPR